MSRRSLPRISSHDLRDHADEARIGRVWARIEQDLPALDGDAGKGRRRLSIGVTLLAASLGLFGAGLLVGKSFWGHRAVEVANAIPSQDHAAIDVLATGTGEKTFPLPVGGQITLSPGSIVEVERHGEGVMLRLMQGEASLDAGSTKADLSIVAGEAMLRAQAGSALRVRKNQDDMDVSVSNGLVSLSSPAGSQQLGGGQRAEKVPIHTLTASVPAAPRHGGRVAIAARRPNDPPVVVQQVAASQPDWLVASANGDHQRAFELLKKSAGGVSGAIDSASSADELMRIGDEARVAGDEGTRIRSYDRILRVFPSNANAQFAAKYLADILEKQGKTDEANKLRDSIKIESLKESTLCQQIRAAQKSAQKDEAVRLAKGYASTYPDGQCKADVESVLQGDGGAPDETAPASPSAIPSSAPSSKPVDKPAP